MQSLGALHLPEDPEYIVHNRHRHRHVYSHRTHRKERKDQPTRAMDHHRSLGTWQAPRSRVTLYRMRNYVASGAPRDVWPLMT